MAAFDDDLGRVIFSRELNRLLLYILNLSLSFDPVSMFILKEEKSDLFSALVCFLRCIACVISPLRCKTFARCYRRHRNNSKAFLFRSRKCTSIITYELLLHFVLDIFQLASECF